MAGEFGTAVLAAGAIGSAGAGVWVLWRMAPAAQRIKRRAGRERVRLRWKGGEEQLTGILPALAAALALYVTVLLLSHRSGLAFAVALGGFMLPTWTHEWRETRRLVQLSEQLGRVMAMVSISLRRGTPLEGALAEAAGAVPEPLGPVLRNLADATVLGVTLSQASEQVRTLPAVAGSTDFQVFSTELVICHERGANVVQAFEALREVLTARRKYRDQVQEHMAQHLLQSVVIAAVGLSVLLVYSQMTPDGLGPLLESLIGQLLLAAAVLGNLFLIRLSHLSMLRQMRKV